MVYIEHAQQIANHESPRTTKLYDRTNDAILSDEFERILSRVLTSGKRNGEVAQGGCGQRLAADLTIWVRICCEMQDNE